MLVPVLNEERYIEASVAAMRRQRFAGELEFVFADGGSTDRTREILDELARRGPAHPRIRQSGTNRLERSQRRLRHARGRWALRMDAHTVYPDDYALLGVQRLQRGDTRWVTGPQVPRGHGPVSRAVAARARRAAGPRRLAQVGRPEAARRATSSSSTPACSPGSGNAATLLEYGGWDERWPRNSDSEMAARFLERGESLICLPAMGAEYVPRDSLAASGASISATASSGRGPPCDTRPRCALRTCSLPASCSRPAPRSPRRAASGASARLGIAAYGVSLAAAGLRARARVDSTRDRGAAPGRARHDALRPRRRAAQGVGHSTARRCARSRWWPASAACWARASPAPNRLSPRRCVAPRRPTRLPPTPRSRPLSPPTPRSRPLSPPTRPALAALPPPTHRPDGSDRGRAVRPGRQRAEAAETAETAETAE